MSVDDLFSGADAAGPVDPHVILRGVRRWTILGGVLNYTSFLAAAAMVLLRVPDLPLPEAVINTVGLGFTLISFLAAPGAFVSIWAWIRAEETLKKARTGALPEAVGPAAHVARQRAFFLLGISAMCLAAQIWALRFVWPSL